MEVVGGGSTQYHNTIKNVLIQKHHVSCLLPITITEQKQ